MTPYKNIIFDMGMVLLDYDPVRSILPYTDDPQIIREIRMLLYHSSEWILMDAGLITDEEAMQAILPRFHSNEVRDIARKAFDCWHVRNLTVHEGMPELVLDLKNAGKNLYILSNISLRLAEDDYWKTIVPHAELFDGAVLSAEVKFLKPQKQIYETLLQTYGLNAADCFFIDDAPRNIEGAARCGIAGYVFDGDTEKLRRTLGI